MCVCHVSKGTVETPWLESKPVCLARASQRLLAVWLVLHPVLLAVQVMRTLARHQDATHLRPCVAIYIRQRVREIQCGLCPAFSPEHNALPGVQGFGDAVNPGWDQNGTIGDLWQEQQQCKRFAQNVWIYIAGGI